MYTPDRPVVAAFDFDGTLTYTDTLMLFLTTIAGIPRTIAHMVWLAPTLVAYAGNRVRNDVAKEQVLSRFIAGMPVDRLKLKAEWFADRVILKLLRPKAMARLKWHQRQNHRCILLSASLELYIEPWAISVGFNDVLGSKLELDAGKLVTGKLQGNNCYGEEKRHRLDELLGPRNGYMLFAYGDSQGDRRLLDYADYGYYRDFPRQ